MKMNKTLSLLTATAIAASAFTGVIASAATADDIVPISATSTYWFGDYITSGVTKGDLIVDDHFYSPTGNSYAANKGNYEGHLNCLRLKNVQDMLQFEVAKPAEITIYSMSHASRGVVVTSTVPSSAYASYDAAIADTANVIAAQPVSSTSFTFTVDAATDFCLSNYGGDFFIAGISVTINTTEPSIVVSPASKTINLGDSLTLEASTQNTGDSAVVWASDNEAVATVADGVVTSVAPGTANITATVNVGGVDYTATCALTVLDVATVTYALGDVVAEGTVPPSVTVTRGETATVPVNTTLYVEGKTLTAWTDGTTNYVAGDVLTLNNDVTLTPVFTDNTAKLGDAEATVVFNFGRQNGAPIIQCERNTAILVAQATIGDAVIDVKMDIDTVAAGKFNNASRTDTLTQLNDGTTLIVPVLAGSTVTVGNISRECTYTINDETFTAANGTHTVAADGTATIVAGVPGGSYWEGVTVTYPKVEAVVTPEPTDPPAPAIEWTAAGTTTVTEDDGVYTVTQPANEAAAPVSTDLLKIMADAPADLTAADGVITVSYDLYRPSEMKGSSNWFIDISTNTNVPGWTGGNAGTFGRLSGYGPWGNNFKLIPGTGATNGTSYQFNNAKDDEWTTVAFTIDLAEKTVKAAMGEDSSEAMADAYPTGIENALYLNVEPCDSSTGNDVSFQIKNIAATYATPDPNATPTPTPEPTPIPEPPVIPEGVTLHKYPASNEYVTNGNQCTDGSEATFVDGVDETVKAYFADPTNGNAVDPTLVAYYKNYISGTASNGTHPSIKATLGAGTHTIYVLGYNHGNNITATIGGTTYTAGAGVDFIKNAKGILKVYAIEITLAEAVTDAEIVFDSSDQWLPDTYAYVIAEVAAPVVEKTNPTVAVSEFGTFTENTDKPAKAYLGTFTVDETVNNPVNSVIWTVGEATAVSDFGTTISSGTVVTGLVVVAADLDAIPTPTAEALFAE